MSPAFVAEPSVPSNTIFSSNWSIPTAVLKLILTCSSNNVSNVGASSGENVVVSPSYPATPAAVAVILAEICDAILTLPNGANPDGWTALFNSFKYVESDSPILTS